jgi:hypothetical protein
LIDISFRLTVFTDDVGISKLVVYSDSEVNHRWEETRTPDIRRCHSRGSGPGPDPKRSDARRVPSGLPGVLGIAKVP